MCFGNDDPPPPPNLPPPPPPPEMMDVIDEITGTQSLVVTGPDGKKRRVTSRLPRTPEEEQRFKAAEDLLSTSMENVRQLYQYNPRSAVDYAPIIDTFANINRERMEALGQIANLGNIQEDVAQFKEMQKTLIDEQFQLREEQDQRRRAHNGRGGGSFAQEARANMARQHGLARAEGDAKASMYAEDLASKRLNRNKEAFNLSEMGREGRLQEANTRYGLAKDFENDMERRRQQAIEENKGLMNIGSGIVGADLNKALAGDTAGISLNTFNAQANDSISRYNADVNRQMANYKMANEAYDKQPPGIGEMALKAGAAVVGTYFGGPMGGAAAYKAADSMTGSGRRRGG